MLSAWSFSAKVCSRGSHRKSLRLSSGHTGIAKGFAPGRTNEKVVNEIEKYSPIWAPTECGKGKLAEAEALRTNREDGERMRTFVVNIALLVREFVAVLVFDVQQVVEVHSRIMLTLRIHRWYC
jgi:hypothetical protein